MNVRENTRRAFNPLIRSGREQLRIRILRGRDNSDTRKQFIVFVRASIPSILGTRTLFFNGNKIWMFGLSIFSIDGFDDIDLRYQVSLFL